jgi:type IV pilus assembly protein PilX
MQTFPTKQRGAVLVVGLVLLLVLTVLAVSTIRTASLEVAMAANTRYSENAFQLAESAIDFVMVNGAPFDTLVPFVQPQTPAPYGLGSFQATVTFDEATPPPAGGFSIGAGSGTFSALHFDIASQGQSNRGATSQHTQSFYVIGPGGP